MASTTALNTQTATFSVLIGNAKSYHVPAFQRDYSWDIAEWEDLWFDLIAIEPGQVHYMGYAVLQASDGKRMEIIDGQQRFATLSILALAAMKLIGELVDPADPNDPNAERMDILRTKFIGHKDAASLLPVSKLKLNRNNDDFYQSYLLRLREPPARHRLKPSERLMWKAFEFFLKALKEHFHGRISGESLARFLDEHVGEQLLFTVINVSDDLSAYRVFETLNARGVKLSSTDLLKNYLFSVVHRHSPSNLEETERQWQSVNNTLGSEELPAFVRHYWNSRNPLQRKQGLFKAIKNKVTTDTQVFELLNQLEKFAPLEVALSRPDEPIWTPAQRREVKALDLFSVSQFFPLVFSAWEYWQPEDLASLLRMCVVISFRYNVISGLNPNTLEDKYNVAARKVASREATTCSEVFRQLKDVYVEDSSFQSAFAVKSLSTNGARWRRLVRYILVSIEKLLSGTEVEFDLPAITIEHILPENPREDWDEFFKPEDQERFMYRLGNYTLLESSRNKDCGNCLFPEKKAVYQTSSYKLTSEEIRCEEWTPQSLDSRQERLAKLAAQVWRVDY